MKEFITALLTKTLNLSAEKVASLFNEDGSELLPNALNEILALNSTHVNALKTENQTYFDNGYKKAQSEVLVSKEKEVKEKFGFNSDKKGLELIEEIIISEAGKKVNLQGDNVKLHPEFVKLQDELNAKIKTTETDWQSKFDNREKDIVKEKNLTNISKKADTLLAQYGLPEDANLSANQKILLKFELDKYNFQPNGDDFIISDNEGKPVNDEHGHRITVDTLIHKIASKYWLKLDGEQRRGSGASNDVSKVDKDGKPLTINPYKNKINNEEDFIKALSVPGLKAEDRILIDAAYSENDVK